MERAGLDRKRKVWAKILSALVSSEFDCLRKADVRFNSCLLQQFTIDTIRHIKISDCNSALCDTASKSHIDERTKSAQISRFIQCINV